MEIFNLKSLLFTNFYFNFELQAVNYLTNSLNIIIWKKLMENLIYSIQKIADENVEGFTIYLPSLEPVKNGFVIANSATQGQFGLTGLKEVVEFAMIHNRIVGGYLNSEGVFQYDASIVEPDREKAIATMILHQQECIYNLETGEMIWNDEL